MRISLVGTHRAPGEARDFVRTQLSGITMPAGVPHDDVVLIASELVTNAVQAGAASVEVALEVTDHRVRICVDDDAEGWPVPRSPSLDEPNGRGLTIIERLADMWTITPRSPGKSSAASWFYRKHRA